jgi:hypothetical protein
MDGIIPFIWRLLRIEACLPQNLIVENTVIAFDDSFVVKVQTRLVKLM